MPPHNKVKCLQSLALEEVSKYIIEITPILKKHPYGSREYFIKNLHAWARTEILEYTNNLLINNSARDFVVWNFLDGDFELPKTLKVLAIMGAKLSTWLVILNTMLDVGVSRLPPVCFYSCMETEFHQFVTILKNSKVHLKELNVNFQMSNKNDYTDSVYNSMHTLQLTLHESLASKLVSLKLIAICDNTILKAIGEHALCLKYLDLSGSWNVDETGITNLLFKNNVCLDTNSSSNDKLCQQLSKLYDSKSLLNHCCFTLEELRIQDTNTEDASLLMIVACVKSLKTLGGFLYFRNIGDALVSVWENSPKPRVFQLTELFDMQLTDQKIDILKECLPHMNKLYTRLSCICTPQDYQMQSRPADLEQGSMFWDRVKMLTIDLDYMMNVHFFNFLDNYGHNLLELNILGQESDFDIAKLLTSCPNLLVLKGHLDIFETPLGQFTKLKSIELINPAVDVINWFFENCPCLEEAKLECDPRRLYWNSQIFQKPTWIMRNNLKRLEVHFVVEAIISTEHLNIKSFIDKCSKLQHLGRLDGWCTSLLTDDLRKHVKTMNYNLHVY